MDYEIRSAPNVAAEEVAAVRLAVGSPSLPALISKNLQKLLVEAADEFEQVGGLDLPAIDLAARL